MPRPGAVIEVDRNTPPVLFHFGEGIRLEKLPLGARIVYPPDPLEPIAHPERAIKRALAKPLDDDPLKSLLRRGMKLTVAFDDLSLPLPPMAAPELKLEELTGPLFGLGEYRDAIAYAMRAGALGAVKVAFDLRGLRA